MRASEDNPCCARCAFPDTDLTVPKTYAVALLTGRDSLATVWAREFSKSARTPDPPMHTFCVRCRQSAWVARRPAAQDALAAHLTQSRMWSQIWHNFRASEGRVDSNVDA